MNDYKLNKKIKDIHGEDREQLDFIFSKDKHIIVTAPAGCGKTKSMVSKIAYEITKSKGKNLKRILALTFSVNAALKIKDDISEILPELLDNDNYNLNKKLDISNYHGFARNLIKNHGYVLNKELRNIDEFEIVFENTSEMAPYMTSSELVKIQSFKKDIDDAKCHNIDHNFNQYFEIIMKNLVSKSIITYNAMLVIAIKLLEIQTIKNFYSKYYQMIIVDEFQDTNYLSYKLITKLINESNKVILMGDDIQKIYSFIGAIPNVFEKINKDFDMEKIEFMTNYRFKENKSIKKLDEYLRGIFKNYDDIREGYSKTATLKFGFFRKARHEASKIVSIIEGNIKRNKTSAILYRAGWLAENVEKELIKRDIKYFYGLFSDTDPAYQKFHEIALELFIEESGTSRSVAKRVFSNVKKQLIENKNTITDDRIKFESLLRLLTALFSSISKKTFSRENKYNNIYFILSSYSLKRLMNEIEDKVFLTTIHGSKGLEWDYVFIPEIMDYQFPASRALCRDCNSKGANIRNKNNCVFSYPSELKKCFLEELSLLYVAITRAKIDVYAFANIEEKRGISKRRSCLTSLPNLNLKKIE